MELRSIHLTKQQIQSLTPYEQRILFVGGQILNEQNYISRGFFGSSKSGADTAAHKLARIAAQHQAMAYMRIQMAIAFEGWIFIRDFVAKEFDQALRDFIKPEAAQDFDWISNVFRKNGNFLCIVRNSFAFHYGGTHVSTIMDQALNTLEFTIVLGGSVGNNFYVSSDVAVNENIYARAEGESIAEKQDWIVRQMYEADGKLRNFFESCIIYFLTKAADRELEDMIRSTDVIDAPSIGDLAIPYFMDMSNH